MTTVTEAVTEINNAQPIAESQAVPVNTPAAPRKWQTQAGPIQSKKVQKAIQSISWEGRTYSETSGVIGGEQSTHSYTMIYGGMREDASAALTTLAEKFNYMVTRENYQAIIDECAAVVAQLAKTRPVTDKRVTPEAKAESDRVWEERNAKERAERLARESAYQAEQTAKREATRAQEEAARAAAPVVTGCATVRYNREHDGVEIEFPAKPERSVIDACKNRGFRWSMRSKVWYHKFSALAWADACRIAGIDELPAPTSQSSDPAGSMVQAQEDAFQDAECARIGA